MQRDLASCGIVKPGIALVTALVVSLALPVTAQVKGVPPSVTSIGFGGNFSRPPGVAPSVTSIGPAGLVPNNNLVFPNNFLPNCCFNPFFPNNVVPPVLSHSHHQHASGLSFVAVPYAVPVAVPYAVDDEDADVPQGAGYAGTPAALERRSPDAPSAPRSAPAAEQEAAASPAAETVAPQPPTVLVFKDGHTVEVDNYAIVGDSLYDLTPGHRRKVAMGDLDLQATMRQNDDRGLDFEVPDGSDTN